MSQGGKGAALVLQPEDGESFWQPVPANGYTMVKLSPRNPGLQNNFSMGVQVIAPGCYIREHWHPAHDEALFFFEGRGRAVIDGEDHRIVPGVTVYVGPWRKHMFVNEGDGPLKMVWVFAPSGIEHFFAAIGRRRRPGDPTPEPFPRPENVLSIEAETVFAPIDATPPAD